LSKQGAKALVTRLTPHHAGTYVLSSGYYDAYYKKACLIREEINRNLMPYLKNVTCSLLLLHPIQHFR